MAEPAAESSTLQELIARFGQGDDAAFATLLRHNSERLESLARHMLRGYPALRRWVETDDVLQNAFMRLMRAIEEVRIESPRHLPVRPCLTTRQR